MEADLEAALRCLICSSLAAFKASSIACFRFREAASNDSFFGCFLQSGLDDCFSSSSVTFATPLENVFVAVALFSAAAFALNTLVKRFVSQDIITNLYISCAFFKFLNICSTHIPFLRLSSHAVSSNKSSSSLSDESLAEE